MRRFIFTMMMLLLTLVMWAADGNGHFHLSLRSEHVPAESIEARFAQWFTLPAGTEWHEVSRRTDALGMTRIEYRQYVGGIEVEHSQILLHVQDGRVLTVNGVVMESHRTPQAATGFGQGPGYYSPLHMEGQLLLVDTPDGYRYATKRLTNKGKWVYTDIETGQQIKELPAYHQFTAGDTPVTVQGTGIYCGNVTLNAVQQADGSYGLYDSERNIYTVNAANILSLDTLAKYGRLGEFFPQEVIPDELTAESLSDMKFELLKQKIDISKYLRSGGVVSSHDNQFFAYKLKKMTIERAKAADEQGMVYDLLPTEGSPTGFRTQFRYGKTDGALYDYFYQITELASPVVLDDFQKGNIVLPREGVTLNLICAKPKSQNPEEQIIRRFVIYFEPDASGKTVIDREELKLTIEYEQGGSPAVDAHHFLCTAYDYYKEVFGRNGYNGQNAPLYNTIFLPSPDNLLSLVPIPDDDDMDDDDMDDAIAPGPNDAIDEVERTINYIVEMTMFNSGVNRNYNPFFMAVGMGGYAWKYDNFFLPIAEKGILCHEYTHMVTGTTAKLEYINEAGALNESFSDIMAISIMKSSKFGNGPETPWVIGANVMSGVSNQRDMQNPKNGLDGKDPSPDTYEGEYWIDPETDTSDSGGVHHNSGVQNKFYYLLCDGGEGTNDKGFTYNVTGIGIEKGQQIAYRTLVQYAVEQSNYADIRQGFIEAATDLYGANSAEVTAVKQAWDAVGVKASDIPDGMTAIQIKNDMDDNTVYDLSGRRVLNLTRGGIYIRNGKKYVVR